jgi:hypothetical protein
LLGDESKIKHDPAEHTRAELHPALEVNLADKRNRDAWVEFTTDKPVIDDVARMTACSELALVDIARLDSERLDVDESGKTVRDEDVASEQLEVISIDELPDLEVRATDESSCGTSHQSCHRGEKC